MSLTYSIAVGHLQAEGLRLYEHGAHLAEIVMQLHRERGVLVLEHLHARSELLCARPRFDSASVCSLR